MAPLRVLLPYNYSPNDQKAIHFVIDAISPARVSRLTLFHAHTPLPAIDVTASPENIKMRDGMRHLSSELAEKENALKAVAEMLVQSGFDPQGVGCVFKRRDKSVAEEIIDQAAGFNLLLLSRGAGKVTHYFTRSIYSRVVAALNGVTICVCT